jgi:hypothetical protein
MITRIGAGIVMLTVLGALAGCQADYENAARATAAAQNAESAASRAEAAVGRAEQGAARAEAAAQRLEDSSRKSWRK